MDYRIAPQHKIAGENNIDLQYQTLIQTKKKYIYIRTKNSSKIRDKCDRNANHSNPVLSRSFHFQRQIFNNPVNIRFPGLKQTSSHLLDGHSQISHFSIQQWFNDDRIFENICGFQGLYHVFF